MAPGRLPWDHQGEGPVGLSGALCEWPSLFSSFLPNYTSPWNHLKRIRSIQSQTANLYVHHPQGEPHLSAPVEQAGVLCRTPVGLGVLVLSPRPEPGPFHPARPRNPSPHGHTCALIKDPCVYTCVHGAPAAAVKDTFVFPWRTLCFDEGCLCVLSIILNEVLEFARRVCSSGSPPWVVLP